MKNLFHQTKQAFYFSLAFYLMAIVLMLFKVSFAPVLFSISLLISLIWVFLTIREILLSKYINNTERMLLVLFLIFFNILAGVVYFFIVRNKVIGSQKTK